MALNKPSFPISFSFEEAVALIESVIQERRWTDFEVASVKLVYTPYWIFHYDAYLESVDQETQDKTVSDLESGEIALNASTRELNDEVPGLLEAYQLEEVKEPEEGYEFEVLPVRVRQRDLKPFAAVKLAQKLNLGKESVLVSNEQLAFVPAWILFVTVAEGTYRIEVNAVTGESFGEEEVPERERGWIEVTQETLQDLQEPGAWAEYSKELAGGILSSLPRLPVVRQFLFNRKLQSLILLLIVLWLLLDALGYL